MNEAAENAHERDFLRRARSGLSPSDADRAFVSASVAVTLAAGASEQLDSASSAAGATSSFGTHSLFGSSLAKLGLVAALTAGASGGGYYFGYRAGRNAAPLPVTELAKPKAMSAAPPTPPETSSSPAPAPVPLAKSDPEPRAPAAAQRAPSASASTSPVDPLLQQETRLLTRIERSLRDQNPRLALGLLGELDRTVPQGQLGEERDAARVIAHCQLGSETAEKLAADFSRRHPASAYLARMKETCPVSAAMPRAAPTPE